MRRTCRTSAAFTLVELLVVILIISVLAGFLVPVVSEARRRVWCARCLNNLRNIGQLAVAYAEDNRGFIPVASGGDPRAYQSFQLLVNEMLNARDPELYVCPVSKDSEAQPPYDGAVFELTEDNVSYAWRNKPLRVRGSAYSKTPLGCDDSIADPREGIEENHLGGMNVLYLDTSVRWVSLRELNGDAAFAEEGLRGWLAEHNLGR